MLPVLSPPSLNHTDLEAMRSWRAVPDAHSRVKVVHGYSDASQEGKSRSRVDPIQEEEDFEKVENIPEELEKEEEEAGKEPLLASSLEEEGFSEDGQEEEEEEEDEEEEIFIDQVPLNLSPSMMTSHPGATQAPPSGNPKPAMMPPSGISVIRCEFIEYI